MTDLKLEGTVFNKGIQLLTKIAEIYHAEDSRLDLLPELQDVMVKTDEVLKKLSEPDIWATPAEIQTARELYQNDDVEIDDFEVRVSYNDTGRWVAAWVFVSNADMGEEESEDS